MLVVETAKTRFSCFKYKCTVCAGFDDTIVGKLPLASKIFEGSFSRGLEKRDTLKLIVKGLETVNGVDEEVQVVKTRNYLSCSDRFGA